MVRYYMGETVGDNSDFLEISGIHHAPLEKRELLSERDFPLLVGLSPLSMRILNNASRVMHVSKDVEMLHEGDTPHDLYFIKQGSVSIVRKFGSKSKTITQLKTGDVYGEFGTLRKKSRYASVYTLEPSTIIRVEMSALQQVLDADSEFRERLEAILAKRVVDSYFLSHPVFYDLPDPERYKLTRALPVQFCDINTKIFSQGKPPKGIYLILSGEVEIRYTNSAGEERLLEIRRDMDLLGEVSIKNGTELAYTAVAASDVDMLFLDPAAMKEIHAQTPETFKKLQQFINERIEKTVVRLKENMKKG